MLTITILIKTTFFSHLSLHRLLHKIRTFYTFLTIIKFDNLLG